MKTPTLLLCTILLLNLSPAFAAEDRVELETTFIKGNKELPQVLYIVPWRNNKKLSKKQDVIVLHSLFGEIFSPTILNDRHIVNK